MTEAETFLARIIAEPEDDTYRLVYADWLDEKAGSSDRAEFIRLQCEYERTRSVAIRERVRQLLMKDTDALEPCSGYGCPEPNVIQLLRPTAFSWWQKWVNATGPQTLAVRTNVHSVWASVGPTFEYPAVMFFDVSEDLTWVPDIASDDPPAEMDPSGYCRWEFRRGFLSHVVAHWRHWRYFGPHLLLKEPIVSVELAARGRPDEPTLRRLYPKVIRWILP